MKQESYVSMGVFYIFLMVVSTLSADSLKKLYQKCRKQRLVWNTCCWLLNSVLFFIEIQANRAFI